MATKQKTITQSVTSTQLAVATLAMLAAGGAALVAAPVNRDVAAVPSLEQCAPAIIEVSQPCEAVVPGQPRAVPGYRRMRYVCPGVQTGMVSTGSCRTEEKMHQDAAKGCQSRNQCAAPGQSYGYNAPIPGYGYNVNRQQALPPVVSFEPDSPSADMNGSFRIASSTTVVAKLHVENQNNVAMYIDGMHLKLYSEGVGFGVNTSTRWIDVADRTIYGRGVNARADWRPRMYGQTDVFNFNRGQFNRALIPANSSTTFYISLSLNRLQYSSDLQSLLAISLAPENALSWTVGDQRGDQATVSGLASRVLIRPDMAAPSANWSFDTPSGMSAAGVEQTIGKFGVSNSSFSGGNIEIERVALRLGVGFTNWQNVIGKRVSLFENGRMVGSVVLSQRDFNDLYNPNRGYAAIALDTPVSIAPGATKELTARMDTSDAQAADTLSVMVQAIEYRSAISNAPGIRPVFGLPFSWKTLTY